MNDRIASLLPGSRSGAGTKSRLYAMVVPGCSAERWLRTRGAALPEVTYE